VEVARAILKDAFGLELLVLGAAGPAAHVRGGVMQSSSEACRVALFTRDGFAKCDAFYREVAAGGPEARACHLGLTAVAVPAVVEGVTIAHVCASGFVATGIGTVPPVPPDKLANALRALDPHLADPSEPVRKLPVVKGDRIEAVKAILRAAATEIADHAGEVQRRGRRGSDLPGRFGLVGGSPRMTEVFELLERVMKSHATVLVTGESGTGKELVARALHDHGPRKGKPFVAQSCGAIPDDLLESLMFGHVRGAFSGAIRGSTGLFGAADGGTLFLDEVGEMSASLQVKVLRVLQDGTYTPVGATSPRKADVRVITASHRDLAQLVERGEMRQDLFYRLHVLTIRMPPLRERAGDLPLLVQKFLREMPGAPSVVSDAAWRCLERYEWPGNVRELRSEIERWQVTAMGAKEIGPEHLSASVREAGGYSGERGGVAAQAAAGGEGSLDEAVEGLERAIITRGLERTKGNRTQLAKELKISRTTLNERIRRYGLGE
jgi:transcriptional regulator with PAS, ATPase and Fis domain